MTLYEVSELFDYLNHHPTEADILTAVYEVKPKFDAEHARRVLGPNPQQTRREQSKFEREFNQLPSMFGQAPGQAPDATKESFRLYDELAKKMGFKQQN